MRKAKKLYAAIALALAAMLVASTAAIAAVTFDPATGTGFVGKGDVQQALGLNNAQVQNAALAFSVRQTTDSTWDCLNSKNEKIQERNRTTTTQDLLHSTARVKNQITGYNITGYVPGSSTTLEEEGPKFESCPAGDDWSLVPNSTQQTVGASTLYVNGVALQ